VPASATPASAVPASAVPRGLGHAGLGRATRPRVARAYDLAVSTSSAAPHNVRRAAIANLGCKVNQSEMDAVERLLRERGVELVGAHHAADLVVINTCTVTSVADGKSRQAVRRARRTSPDARILITGCSVAIDPDSLAAADPLAALFDNDSKGRLMAELAGLLEISDGRPMPTLSGVERVEAIEPSLGRAFELEADEDSMEPDFDDRADIDRTRAFVKIQDGCSFHCTYCIIPRARGPERSIPAGEVVSETERATSAGHSEAVLTGINAGTYDDAGLSLAGLVRRILAETAVERIRLSSIEPQHVTPELLDVWAGSGGRCLPHFHIPLQSGDDTILRRMGRRYDTAFYRELVARVRRVLPGAAVHADVIVGFPGEDDESWARTATLLRDLDLAGVHVFRYSARPGTPAARMVGQVDARTRKRRAAEALSIAAEARARFAQRHLGRELRVLFEKQLPDGRWLGHAESHVLVAAGVAPGAAPAPGGLAADGAAPAPGGLGTGESLARAIGLVRADSIDPAAPDRIVGRLLSVVPPVTAPIVPGTMPANEPLAESALK
jgi:threonylcarbamoyladenosine tRNA methylthiotransferase MtaB